MELPALKELAWKFMSCMNSSKLSEEEKLKEVARISEELRTILSKGG